MMFDNVLDNQSIVLGRLENFLWRFEVEFHSQLFGARFHGRHGERKIALRECKTTSSSGFKLP